jgi:hypothetical protein
LTSKKAAEREKRRAAKIADFEASKATLLQRMAVPQTPVVAQTPVVPGLPQVGASVSTAVPSIPIAAFSGSRYDLRLDWCITRADRVGVWSWNGQRDWSQEHWDSVINPGLSALKGRLWRDVQLMTAGNAGHLRHHEQPVSSVIKEAQDRWIELGLEAFDTFFRFRFGNKQRVWGFVVQHHFFFVWWDPEHKIYPTEPN